MPSVKVLSAGSALYGMRPAAQLFARETGIAVEVETDHGHNIEKAALGSATDADIVVIPSPMMNELVAAGRVDHATLVEIGAVRIGAAVHEMAVRPDVARVDALRNILLTATEVLLTHAPTGQHLARMIAEIGIAKEVAPKISRFDTATLLNGYIAERPGSGAIGFAPTTEILAWRGRGVALAGTLPEQWQVVLPYQAGMLKRTQSADSARRLLSFLATSPVRRQLRDSGME